MQRDINLDGLKFVLIFLVVLGHLQYNDYGLRLNRMIYSFHMPVFVFLSGYLTSLKSDKGKRIAWVRHTALVFILAHLGHIFLDVVFRITLMARNESLSYDILSLSDFTTPKFALWYILCLIYWRIMAWTLFPKMNDILLLIVSFLFAFIAGIIPISQTLSFQRAFSFLPFFVLGIVFKKHNLTNKITKVHFFIPIVVIVIGLLISRELPLFQPREHYENWNDAIIRIFQTTIGLLLCLSIYRISKSSKIIGMFSRYGLFTLWIYIGHTFLISIERKVFPRFGITYNVFLALIIATLYCTIFIMMAKYYNSKKKNKST